MDSRLCCVTGCPDVATTNALCATHQGTNLPERFWAKVKRGGSDECWPWTAARVSAGTGYGWFGITHRPQRTSVLAHRYAYELLVGPIPEGLELDHLCRNSMCVNPSHLEPVTHAENVRRGLLYRVRVLPKLCKAEGCDVVVRQRTYCDKHYARLHRHGDPLYVTPGHKHHSKNRGLECREAGCAKDAKTRGWCNMHYTRWKRHGDPQVVKQRGPDSGPRKKYAPRSKLIPEAT